MSMADATAALVHQVFAQLVRDGAVPRSLFENIANAHDRIADEALVPAKKAFSEEVAEVARIVVALADEPPVRPTLRLVDNDNFADDR